LAEKATAQEKELAMPLKMRKLRPPARLNLSRATDPVVTAKERLRRLELMLEREKAKLSRARKVQNPAKVAREERENPPETASRPPIR
jgi:hypothetical protein